MKFSRGKIEFDRTSRLERQGKTRISLISSVFASKRVFCRCFASFLPTQQEEEKRVAHRCSDKHAQQKYRRERWNTCAFSFFIRSTRKETNSAEDFLRLVNVFSSQMSMTFDRLFKRVFLLFSRPNNKHLFTFSTNAERINEFFRRSTWRSRWIGQKRGARIPPSIELRNTEFCRRRTEGNIRNLFSKRLVDKLIFTIEVDKRTPSSFFLSRGKQSQGVVRRHRPRRKDEQLTQPFGHFSWLFCFCFAQSSTSDHRRTKRRNFNSESERTKWDEDKKSSKDKNRQIELSSSSFGTKVFLLSTSEEEKRTSQFVVFCSISNEFLSLRAKPNSREEKVEFSASNKFQGDFVWRSLSKFRSTLRCLTEKEKKAQRLLMMLVFLFSEWTDRLTRQRRNKKMRRFSDFDQIDVADDRYERSERIFHWRHRWFSLLVSARYWQKSFKCFSFASTTFDSSEKISNRLSTIELFFLLSNRTTERKKTPFVV